MKQLPLVILSILICSGCTKYGSFYEANKSCIKWANEAGTYSGIIQAKKKTDLTQKGKEYLYEDTTNTFPMRKCQLDKETKQLLGLSATNRDENKTYYFPETQRLKNSPENILDININWEVEQRFKY